MRGKCFFLYLSFYCFIILIHSPAFAGECEDDCTTDCYFACEGCYWTEYNSCIRPCDWDYDDCINEPWNPNTWCDNKRTSCYNSCETNAWNTCETICSTPIEECEASCLEECDPDGDGISSETDNCPDSANADQADQDNDGIGDVCDSEPYFFWPTSTEDIDDAETFVLMEDGIVYDSDRQVIIWTTKDPDALGDGLGWASRMGVEHSYVSYREVGGETWSPEEETRKFISPGFYGRWSWFKPALTIPANGNYEIKLISEDSEGNRGEQMWTIEVAVP